MEDDCPAATQPAAAPAAQAKSHLEVLMAAPLEHAQPAQQTETPEQATGESVLEQLVAAISG